MRAFPEQLIGPGEPEPLFTERVHEVATDPAHAARVWRGLERRLVVRARSMLVYAWHGEQERSDLLMLRCMRRVFDEGGGVLADQADPDMKALHRLAPSQKAAQRIFRMTEFCRQHPGRTHVPDPYYEGREGFELVLDLLEDGCRGLLERISAR